MLRLIILLVLSLAPLWGQVAGNEVLTGSNAGEATATPTASAIPIAEADSNINVGWIPLDATYTWTGPHQFNRTVANIVTFQSTATTAGIVVSRDDTTGASQSAHVDFKTVNNGSLWLIGNDLDSDGTSDFGFSDNNGSTDVVIQRTTGNVGIGDLTPDHKLDVEGNIGIVASGYLNFGDTDGTTGYGVRDNSGVVECKDSGGAWKACAGAITQYVYYQAAGCQNTSAATGFNLKATSPAATCNTFDTDNKHGTLDFDADTDETIDGHFDLPPNWTGDIDLAIKWLAVATSGDVEWDVRFQCVDDGEVAPTAWQATSTVVDTAQGTTLFFNNASILAIDTTGCAGGNTLFFEFWRDADDVTNDTMTGDGKLLSLRFTVKDAQQ